MSYTMRRSTLQHRSMTRHGSRRRIIENELIEEAKYVSTSTSIHALVDGMQRLKRISM